MKSTLRDIAKACTMDISTVSRALRDDPRVKPDSRKRIKAVAKKLGYQPNLAARMLVEKKTRTVWMLLPSFTNPVEQFPAQFAAKRLAGHGYDLLATLHHNDDNVFKRLLERLSQGVSDGAIIIPRGDEDKTSLKPLLKRKYPLVLLDRKIAGLDAPFITTDNAAASRQLVRLCHQDGCREFLLLHDDLNSVESERLQSACTELDQLGCTYHCLGRAPLPSQIPVTSAEKVAIIGSAQNSVLNVAAHLNNKLTPKNKIIFATYDTWVGKAFPAEKAYVAIQDLQAMADLAVDTLLKLIESHSHPGNPPNPVPIRSIDCVPEK